MAFSSFALFSSLGGLIWSSSFITLGYFLEEKWSQETARIRHVLEIASVTVIVVAALFFVLRKVKRNA